MAKRKRGRFGCCCFVVVVMMTLLIEARMTSTVRSDKEMRERFYDTSMMNSTSPISNDGTIAKMFDRVLENEFSDNDQPQGLMEMVSWKQVWNALKILDAVDVDNSESSPGIVEIYSLKVVAKSLAGKPEGWNREHLWPRSYGLRKGPSMTDIHNICPADVNNKMSNPLYAINSSRGNKYYGECGVTSAKCLKPANKECFGHRN